MTEVAQIEEQRTLFNIPAENYPKFEEQIAKLSRKAEKLLGFGFKPFVFGYQMVEYAGHQRKVFEVLLNAATPTIAGWTFVARLDHSNETGTIIRMVPNAPALPESYRHASHVRCDHCGVKRYRRDTFVVRNDETGEFKQVGSTCLQDFFDGQDPFKIAKLAELLGYARECGHGAEQFVGGDMRWISVEEYCQAAAEAVLVHGWVSGKAAYESPDLTSTRDIAWGIYSHTGTWQGNHWVAAAPRGYTPAQIELAAEAIAWAQGLSEKTELNDYEHNVSVIAHATVMEPRSLGLAASIVGVYYNNKMRSLQGQRRVDVGDFKGVIELFQKSQAKHPKIRLQLDSGQPIVLAVAGSGAKHPGSINVTDGRPFGENQWFGRVMPDGVWERGRTVQGQTMTSLTALLSALASDPAGTAAAYGKLTGNCCFCSRGLDDARSMEVGYGPVCAKKFQLPWGAK